MFPLAVFSPGHSVSSSIDPLLMLFVDVASFLWHAWWYKMVFLSQLSLCSKFGFQILVRRDRCRGDQGLVMIGRWGKNKCFVLLYVFFMQHIIELWQLWKSRTYVSQHYCCYSAIHSCRNCSGLIHFFFYSFRLVFYWFRLTLVVFRWRLRLLRDLIFYIIIWYP